MLKRFETENCAMRKKPERIIGTQGVLRAYIPMASTQKDRVRAVSIGAASEALGIFLGPALVALFTPLGYPGYCTAIYACRAHLFSGVNLLNGALRINMYTLPAFVGAAGLGAMIVLMYAMFHERSVGIASENIKSGE